MILSFVLSKLLKVSQLLLLSVALHSVHVPWEQLLNPKTKVFGVKLA